MKRSTKMSKDLLPSYDCPVCGKQRSTMHGRECDVCVRRANINLRVFLKQHKNDTVDQLLEAV